ncbi:MAG: transglutaminase domain-containing protein [Ignavibacteria bacterium]|nr:transglutaminase domain-containing protein [Ignavibacteria bacterium]
MKYLFVIFMATSILFAQNSFSHIDSLIESGSFSQAQKLITETLTTPGTTPLVKWELEFRQERMARIRADFNKTEDQVLGYIKKYIPEADATLMRKWENNQTLEMKNIDGNRWYFSLAARNLFRLDADAKKRFETIEGLQTERYAPLLESELPQIIAAEGGNLRRPIEITCSYTLTVKPDAVPAGEIIRCWMPYPRTGELRQKNVQLVSSGEPDYIISPASYGHQSIYMQKPAIAGQPVVFTYSFKYTAFAEYYNLDVNKINFTDVPDNILQQYTREELPQIKFTETIKKLSNTIVGTEKDKTQKLLKIYSWISNNIPWASAREYSTIPDIPAYCAINGHGDCGIQSLLFITLCRYNGIPARWQSGWMLHPNAVNLHDWAEMYVAGAGWVPVDQSFGLQESTNPKIHWYFLGNSDQYHLIVNSGVAQNFYPEKSYPRSETVDFQRGEVEWRGGNLYFDKWGYDMKVSYITK